MRENRTHGSEGGEGTTLPDPYRCMGVAACFETRPRALLRACEFFAQFCSIKRLQQVVMVLLRGADDWSEGKPVGVGQ